MRNDKWVIEARDSAGKLLFDVAQPESFFGLCAIQGITEDQMAQAIFRKVPDAVMLGTNIPAWPKLVNAAWSARRKTW